MLHEVMHPGADLAGGPYGPRHILESHKCS
jgi:hypothetical protein